MGAGVSGILDAEPSNGKSSLFQRSSEREREREKRIELEAWRYVKHQ